MPDNQRTPCLYWLSSCATTATADNFWYYTCTG